MSKISLIAKLPCAEGQNEGFEAALADMITASNEEAGLEIYSAHKGADNNYWFFELYTDHAALEVHGKGDVMKIASVVEANDAKLKSDVTTSVNAV